MGIFDNAKSIVIGDKEVKSIEIDGGTIWEKEVEPPAPSVRDITLKCYAQFGTSEPTIVDTSPITLNGVTKNTNNIGGVSFTDVPDGEQTVTLTVDGSKTSSVTITVDASHTTFEVLFDFR